MCFSSNCPIFLKLTSGVLYCSCLQSVLFFLSRLLISTLILSATTIWDLSAACMREVSNMRGTSDMRGMKPHGFEAGGRAHLGILA